MSTKTIRRLALVFNKEYAGENLFRFFFFTKLSTLREKEGKITFLFLVSKRKASLVAPSLRHQLVLDLVVIQSTELWLSAHSFLLDGVF